MVILEIVFWLSVAAIVWIYAGYMLALCVFASGREEETQAAEAQDRPFVTLIIPAYKEEKVIRAKLENALRLDYPKDRMEILVINDGLFDQTPARVQEFAAQSVRLCQQEPRQGKAAGINRGIRESQGEILVVSDANAMMAPDSLRLVVRHFRSSKIGGATGSMRQVDTAQTTVSGGGNLYWRFEKAARLRESQLHSVVSMSGEISAFRKSLFWKNGEIPTWYIHGGTDDLQMSLFIIKQGYRVIYEPRADVWEPAPNTAHDLFKQKVRIIVQTIITVRENLDLLTSRAAGWFGWFIFGSRRALPLLSPLFLLLAFLSSGWLAFSSEAYWWLFAAQVIFYGLGVLGWIPGLQKLPVVRTIHFFLLLNATVAAAWIQYFRRTDYTVWQTIDSSRV